MVNDYETDGVGGLGSRTLDADTTIFVIVVAAFDGLLESLLIIVRKPEILFDFPY